MYVVSPLNRQLHLHGQLSFLLVENVKLKKIEQISYVFVCLKSACVFFCV